jgi:hypothetical protein
MTTSLADTPTSPAIEQLRTVAESRLQELQPVADEIVQLQQVLAVLREPGAMARLPELASLLAAPGQPGAAASPAPVTAPIGRSARLGDKPGRDGRAPQGVNKQLILRTILESPGIKAGDVADRTGLKRSTVFATVNRLKRQGELEVHGKGLRVIGAPDDDATG